MKTPTTNSELRLAPRNHSIVCGVTAMRTVGSFIAPCGGSADGTVIHANA